MLKGESPKSVTKDGDNIVVENNEGQTIVAPRASHIVLDNRTVDNSITQVTNNIYINNPNGGFSFRTEAEETFYSSDNVRAISHGLPCEEIAIHKHIVVRTILVIKKLDLMGKSVWDFYDGNKAITAKIADDAWLERLKRREFLIGYGDALEVDLETDIQLDEFNFPIETTAKHTIVTVTKVLQQYEQTEF